MTAGSRTAQAPPLRRYAPDINVLARSLKARFWRNLLFDLATDLSGRRWGLGLRACREGPCWQPRPNPGPPRRTRLQALQARLQGVQSPLVRPRSLGLGGVGGIRPEPQVSCYADTSRTAYSTR